MKRTFTDDHGKLSLYRIGAGIYLNAGPDNVARCTSPLATPTTAECWVALAEHCERSEVLRGYGRRIRAALGTAAGVDA
jgi:hypothetical protein